MQPPVYHTVVFLHLNLPHFFSSFFFYPLLFLKGAYYTLLELYEEAGSLSVGSLKAQFAAGVSLQEHLLPAAGLELWRVGLENYTGAAVVQMNASGLTYLTRWRKAGLLDEKIKNKCLCLHSDLRAWNAAAYGRRGDTRAAARYIRLDFPVLCLSRLCLFSTASVLLSVSFFLLHSASSPCLCQTCMQSGLCKYSCTRACKTIWISRSTIRDGTRHVPHAHALACTKREIYSSVPLPFLLSSWPDTALGSIPRADPLVGTLM